MWKSYDFRCKGCKHEFDDLVQGYTGTPDECPECKSTSGFDKLVTGGILLTEIIPNYPGSKKRKAGYVHSHGDRPAEKKGSQVSMHIPRKNKG